MSPRLPTTRLPRIPQTVLLHGRQVEEFIEGVTRFKAPFSEGLSSFVEGLGLLFPRPAASWRFWLRSARMWTVTVYLTAFLETICGGIGFPTLNPGTDYIREVNLQGNGAAGFDPLPDQWANIQPAWFVPTPTDRRSA